VTQDNNGATITGLDLSGYIVSDPQRSIAFYRDALGMTPTGVDDNGRGAEFTLPDGQTFGVWGGDDETFKAPSGAVMFAVGDIKEALEAMRARGAQLSDPMESEVCFMSFGADPDGNSFVIHQRKVKD
jgi:predicted enzyme related to lactoylglutathione lyase